MPQSSTAAMPDPAIPDAGGLGRSVVLLFAFACGATTANVYYAQSIAGPIADSLHLPPSLAGLIVTTTQLGYGAGLFFIVCVADLVENRRLVLMATAGTAASLLWVGASNSTASFLLASLALGVCTVGSQILVPLAVHLSPEGQRGRIIGSIMGGLVTGIMLARPLASFLTAHVGWRAVFFVSAAVMLANFALMARRLPRYQPHPGRGYGATLVSTLRLLLTVRPLQRRAAYQGTLFAIFNLFWTGGPLMLHGRFGLGQGAIAAFALVGAAGALAAPMAGRLADRGFSRLGTAGALLCAALAFAVSYWGSAVLSIPLLVLAAVVLDAAVQANQVIGQRIVQGIDARARGRLNAAYMTVLFLCGAAGSALGSVTYVRGGWGLTSAAGVLLALGMFAVFLTERRPAQAASGSR